MSKSSMSKNDLVELVERLRDGVRDARYRELITDYDSDLSIEKYVNELRQDPGEAVVPDRSGR